MLRNAVHLLDSARSAGQRADVWTDRPLQGDTGRSFVGIGDPMPRPGELERLLRG